MAQQTDNLNRVEDTSSKEKKPKAGAETGRQSTYIGANIPGALGAAGILTVNPTALGTLGVAGLGYGGWGGMGGGLSGCAGMPFGWGTPEQFSSSVYGFASIMPGYGACAPGTYLTYRLMRSNPTVAIARMAATAPIRAADITIEGPDASDEQIEFIESIVFPLWPAFIRDAMFALDYGWKAFEKVYAAKRHGGYVVLKKLKPLAPDISQILWNMETGAFDGVRQQDVTLPPEKVFCWTYDQEDDAYYGRSRHENIRGAWWAWMELLRKEGQYIAKVAGVTPVITYPEGTGKDATGADQPNHVLAWQVLQNLGRGNGVAMPNRLAPWAEEWAMRGVDPVQLAAWQVKFLESQGQHGQDFVSQMQHKETLMLRGWLVPERAVTEGQFGTKAEAESHADMAIAIAQHDLFDLLRAFNQNVVDPLLALNFGPEARGLVTVTASPLIDDKAELARTIVQTVLTAPANTELLLKVLNFDAMLEQQGLPVTGVGATEAVDDDEDGDGVNGGQGTDGGDGGTAGKAGDSGQSSGSQEDSGVQQLARDLLRRRELSRWRSGSRGRRSVARSLMRSRDGRAVDLAGYNPDEPRDWRGRWTQGGSVGPRETAGQKLARIEKEIFKGKQPTLGDIERIHLRGKQADAILAAATDANGVPLAHQWTGDEIAQARDGKAQEHKEEADKNLSFMPVPARYRAEAMLLNQKNAKVILAMRVPAFQEYVRELYETLRGLNPAHYIPEKTAALEIGQEPILGNKIDRKQTAKELAVYAALFELGPVLKWGMGELKNYLIPPSELPIQEPVSGEESGSGSEAGKPGRDQGPNSSPGKSNPGLSGEDSKGPSPENGGKPPTPGEKPGTPSGEPGGPVGGGGGPPPEGKLPTKLPFDETPYEQNPSSVVLSPKVDPGNYVYVQDPEGVVHVVPDGDHMHPTVLGDRKPAAGAGTLKINKQGIVVELDNISGTFEFGKETLPRVKAAIERQGLKVAPDAIKPFKWGNDQ